MSLNSNSSDTNNECQDKNKPKDVISANDWEHCALDGDTPHRHNKFMKLMGAEKKVHKGKFVIGDQKERTRTNDQTIQENLCDQYTAGMENRFKRRVGLGFDSDPIIKNTDEDDKQSILDKEEEGKEDKVVDKENKKYEDVAANNCKLKKSGDVKKETTNDSSNKRIHSANDWEHSHLDNDTPIRHDKFMKLMGADKKEHKGQFIIGDSAAHNTVNDSQYKDIGGILEKQFESSEIRTESSDIKQCPSDEKYKGIGFPHISEKIPVNVSESVEQQKE